MAQNENGKSLRLPIWAAWLGGVAIVAILSGLTAWASMIDQTQRGVLQDIAGLKAETRNVKESLYRIESKVDRLLERHLDGNGGE